MNKESANTMLKFLEEPSGNVIGFFITNHKENILPTIASRTQHIEVNFENTNYEKYNISEEAYTNLFEMLKEYLYKVEVERKQLILYNREYLSYLDKESIKVVLQIILDIYNQELTNRIQKSSLKQPTATSFSFLNKLSIPNLKKKINILIELLKEISYNVNSELLLDRLVIEMDGINNENI